MTACGQRNKKDWGARHGRGGSKMVSRRSFALCKSDGKLDDNSSFGSNGPQQLFVG
jgi:hypothetical protein